MASNKFLTPYNGLIEVHKEETMQSLYQQRPVFPLKKVNQVVKAKKRFAAKAVQMSPVVSLETAFLRSMGSRSVLILAGHEEPVVSTALKGLSHMMRVDIEGYYGQNNKSVYFLLVIDDPMDSVRDGDLINEMSALGPSFAKDENDEYVLGGLDDSITKNNFFWNPKFNLDTLKRFAVASLPKLENFYIKDVVLIF